MRDWMHNFATVPAVAPGLFTDDPAPITIDRSGYDAVTFVLMMGIGGITFTPTNRIDVIMEHSDDGATWDPVGGSNVIGAVVSAGGVVYSQQAAHPAPTAQRFGYVDGYVGDRRYVRLRIDFNGTHATDTAMSALAVLGNGRSQPQAA